MKKIINQYILLLIIVFSIASCERVIDLDIPPGEALPYLDAWITNKPGVQTIRFLKATGYTSSQDPAPVADATISVTDLTSNQTYAFTYANGNYTYDAGAAAIGVTGHSYRLNISWGGQQFEAFNEIKRVPAIDSVTVEFKKEESDKKEGYYAKLYARDLPGATDYYWIRTYRNDSLNRYVPEMVTTDASFSENISDGFEFIPPFRDGITSGEKPYIKGDKVKVVLRSLNKPTHDFMEQLLTQISNDGLFSKVLSNVPTNVTNKTAGTTKIYGWFGTVAEVEMTKNVQ
jgi:hypothetical protein